MSESNLQDRAAIRVLFTRYCGALDNGEVEAVVDCFTVDAILKSPVIDISGRDEICAFAGRFAAQRAAGTQFRHMVNNIAVTITGKRAAASAYLLVLISKDDNHRSLPPGRYACELIKDESGEWRFSRRTVFHDHDYTLDGIGRKNRGAASRGPPQPVPPARSSKVAHRAVEHRMPLAELGRLWRRLASVDHTRPPTHYGRAA